MQSVQLDVQPRGPLVAIVGTAKDATQRCEFVRQHHCDHARLRGARVTSKKERTIATYRPANRGAKLFASEIWIRIGRIATQSGVRRQSVIAMKVIAEATRPIRSRACDDVDRTVGRDTRGGVEVHRRNLKLLNDI